VDVNFTQFLKTPLHTRIPVRIGTQDPLLADEIAKRTFMPVWQIVKDPSMLKGFKFQTCSLLPVVNRYISL
jgi:hypothetical protein